MLVLLLFFSVYLGMLFLYTFGIIGAISCEKEPEYRQFKWVFQTLAASMTFGGMYWLFLLIF